MHCNHNFILLVLLCFFLNINAYAQKKVILLSPNKKIKTTISVGETISYSIDHENTKVLLPSKLSLILDNGQELGTKPKLKSQKASLVNTTVKPLYGMASEYKDVFNQVELIFDGNYAVTFRAYDNGVAYRFSTTLKNSITIKNEGIEYVFPNDADASIHQVGGFLNSYEEIYRDDKISYLDSGKIASLPLYVKSNGFHTVITESDLLDYPAFYLTYSAKNTLNGVLPPVVTKDSVGGCCPNFERVPYERAYYIAKTNGTRSYPWRLIVIEKEEKNLLYNNLVYLLATENKIGDASWVKPGKVAWDWWNANNLFGVDFKTGFNTATYKYFIDFAARNGIEYVNLDEGWSDQFDLLRINTGKGIVKEGTGAMLDGGMDMEKVVLYANEKNIGLFLWCVWHTLDRQMIEALDQFQKWGIKGIKVDFMDRDDQEVVNFYERLAAEAAKRKIMINYHGAYKPTGLSRTYPNIINREALRGLEYNKFGEGTATPENLMHQLFIRMVAGEADYTPGAMDNRNTSNFRVIMEQPMSYGTRCQQLALYTLIYAPLAMLADAPTLYEREPAILNYLATVPTVWDETRPIEGKIGDYAVMARRKGSTWHVAGATDNTRRTVKLTFDFLDAGEYTATIFTDGVNADRVGIDYKLVEKTVKKGDSIELNMAPSGGFAIRLNKK